MKSFYSILVSLILNVKYTEENKWIIPEIKDKQNMNLKRVDHIALLNDANLLVMGGLKLERTKTTVTNEVISISIGARFCTVTETKSLFSPRAAHSIAVAFQDNTAMLYGGLYDESFLEDTIIIDYISGSGPGHANTNWLEYR